MPRTYEETHPWLRFALELDFPRQLWLLLGEVRSKCEHLAGVPLQPDTAERLNRVYLAKGVLGTTAIEGNTLSLEDVKKYLEGELHLPPSQEYLKTEIHNIVSACNMVVEHVLQGKDLPLSVEILRSFNRMVLDGLELDAEVTPGDLRNHDVGVARYRGAPWGDCPYLVNRLTEWLAELDERLPDDLGLAKAVLRAIVAHLYIAWIHPFGDGNGRTARLVEFAILVKSGVPMPAAHLLSDHYNQTRTQYYRELDRASKSGGDVIPFITYALQGLTDGLRAQIAEVQAQQLDVAWQNYVHERLPNKSDTEHRRRALVFALSKRAEPVRIRDVMTLTPELAVAYGAKTRKALSRDINALRKERLVAMLPGARVQANTRIMLAFLPARAPAKASSRRNERGGDPGTAEEQQALPI